MSCIYTSHTNVSSQYSSRPCIAQSSRIPGLVTWHWKSCIYVTRQFKSLKINPNLMYSRNLQWQFWSREYIFPAFICRSSLYVDKVSGYQSVWSNIKHCVTFPGSFSILFNFVTRRHYRRTTICSHSGHSLTMSWSRSWGTDIDSAPQARKAYIETKYGWYV